MLLAQEHGLVVEVADRGTSARRGTLSRLLQTRVQSAEVENRLVEHALRADAGPGGPAHAATLTHCHPCHAGEM